MKCRMGLFNGKEVNELVVKTGENSNDIMAIKRDIEDIKLEYEERFKVLLDEILNIKTISDNKISMLEKERDDAKIALLEEIETQKIKGENYAVEDICKLGIIKGMNTAEFKFYLHEKGIMNMSINQVKNSFSLVDNFKDKDNGLTDYIIVVDNKLLFKKSFTDYIEQHKKDIIKSIESYRAKQNQYKKSTQNLASRNVENYRDEINVICGNDSSTKWIAVYKVFSKKFKTFYNDHKKYVEDHKGETMYDITKVRYIVEVMGEGNYLLKIACDLFVDQL